MFCSATAYLDPVDGRSYPIETPRWRSDHGRPLAISELPGIGRDEIDRGENSLWRYRRALPRPVANPISMGEGCTPLVRRLWRGTDTRFKLEWFSPTGSFKDRGASVMLSMLREQGIGHVLEDSSGNGGAAIAAYAAAGGMKAKILAPASTQPGKTVQMRAYGAEVELVPGSRQDTSREAERQAEHMFYASHNWHPFFLHGTKTLAYELWEDLGFREPDAVIMPTGAGSNVLGCDLGFQELLRRGEIKRLPRLYAVQPANCAPIAAAFDAGVRSAAPVEVKRTLAEGTAIAEPIRLGPVLDAIRRSSGAVVTVSEDEIVAAVFDLAATGLYAEPTAASAAAAHTRLVASGAVSTSEVTVVVLTGSGLKATQSISELLNERP